jgi:SAM-dependent methyltransferase
MSAKSEWGSTEQRLIWDREYREGHVIPSTLRSLPSKALAMYDGLVDFGTLSPILDAGCGNGRNAIYLAGKGCEVVAVDYSEAALELTRRRAAEAGVAERIRPLAVTLGDQWPFSDGEFSLVIDSYVFCHILDRTARLAFKNQLKRVLRPSGLLYSAVFSTEDAYYRELAGGGAESGTIVLDPRNGVKKHLYSEEEFRAFFADGFRTRYFAKFHFDDVVCNRVYERSVLTLIAEKQPCRD